MYLERVSHEKSFASLYYFRFISYSIEDFCLVFALSVMFGININLGCDIKSLFLLNINKSQDNKQTLWISTGPPFFVATIGKPYAEAYSNKDIGFQKLKHDSIYIIKEHTIRKKCGPLSTLDRMVQCKPDWWKHPEVQKGIIFTLEKRSE